MSPASPARVRALPRIPTIGALVAATALLWPGASLAADGPALLGVRIEFLLFAATLIGVALFHHHTLRIAVTGLAIVVLYKLAFVGFHDGRGLDGLFHHLLEEWVTLANLFGLLVGFALLAQHFYESRVPQILPRLLPDDWTGGLMLLWLVFVMSAFLDNIAAAMIGGTVATALYKRVHVGFVAAIVAASNAGGAGSVVGDTTTTMIWISGVSPLHVLHAYAAAVPAMLVFSVVAARQQQHYAAIMKDPPAGVRMDWARLAIVAIILLFAIGVNVTVNIRYPEHASEFPFIGAAVWVALLATARWRKPDWKVVPEAARSTMFLLSLVLSASLMPVEELPAASVASTLGLGFVSAVFDNIPLTALAIQQGGYDWGSLAYAVGFGGSMIWFGSSAGVAISGILPQARSVGLWLRHGWHVAVGYVVGYVVLLAALGWQPG
jgi:Na+/H+ antiporter NhaD/arsenite permease-like protein